MKISKFEDLEIWKLSLKITKDIYAITGKDEFSKDYGLRDQVRRAVVSISSNVVEGFEKSNNNEFIRFLRIAKGSVGETKNQIMIASMVGYLSKEKFGEIVSNLDNLAAQIGGFIKYLEAKRKNKEFVNK